MAARGWCSTEILPISTREIADVVVSNGMGGHLYRYAFMFDKAFCLGEFFVSDVITCRMAVEFNE